jgi:hypothetical protein
MPQNCPIFGWRTRRFLYVNLTIIEKMKALLKVYFDASPRITSRGRRHIRTGGPLAKTCRMLLERKSVSHKKFRYKINVRKLRPEISSDLHFAATVSDLCLKLRGSEDKPIVHDFGEATGHTKSEAEKKMRRKVKDWISNYA